MLHIAVREMICFLFLYSEIVVRSLYNTDTRVLSDDIPTNDVEDPLLHCHYNNGNPLTAVVEPHKTVKRRHVRMCAIVLKNLTITILAQLRGNTALDSCDGNETRQFICNSQLNEYTDKTDI